MTDSSQIGAQVRSSNPVLTRPDAFVPAGQQGQQYAQPGFQEASYPPGGYATGYQAAPPAGARMTMNDVIAKTSTLFVILTVVAAVSWIFTATNPAVAFPLAMVSAVVALVAAILVTVRRSTSVPAIMAYTVFEGILIGAFSQMMESLYPGIVGQAVLGTFAAAAVTLFAYRTFGTRISGRMQKIFVFSMIAYAAVAGINLIALLFGVNLGFFNIGAGAGALSWLFAGIGVVLAVVSLLMDFEECERGVRTGAPAKESWRAGFGLMVTMVWLYTNLLRILSFFRN